MAVRLGNISGIVLLATEGREQRFTTSPLTLFQKHSIEIHQQQKGRDTSDIQLGVDTNFTVVGHFFPSDHYLVAESITSIAFKSKEIIEFSR